MKTKILFLALLTFYAVNIFAYNGYDWENVTYKGILSADKSKIWIIKIERMPTSYNAVQELKRSVCLEITICDTVHTYYIWGQDTAYINDSIANMFAHTDTVALPSLLVPRFAHILGKETYNRRQLVAEKGFRIDSIHLYYTGQSFGPAKWGKIFLFALGISMVTIFYWLGALYNMKDNKDNGDLKNTRITIRWVALIMTGFFIILVMFLGDKEQIFNCLNDWIICSLIIFIPSFLVSFAFPKKKKSSQERFQGIKKLPKYPV